MQICCFGPAVFISFLLGILLPPVVGEDLYQKHCSSCHHPQKIGISGPPLLKETIGKYSDEKLKKIIREGIPSTQMPSFKNLSDEDIDKIILYLRGDTTYNWTFNDIRNSLIYSNPENKKYLNLEKKEDITFVVERGKNSVWLMDKDKILDKFEFQNVHGGIKYTLDGENFYIPSRDGWIGYYKIDKKDRKFEGLFVGKVRTCIYLRNIAVSKDGKFLIAGCILPQKIEILDAKTLQPFKEIDLNGKLSAVYELYKEDKALFSYRDKAVIGILDTKNFDVEYKKVEEPIEDFFIDPFDKFLVRNIQKWKKDRCL
ncbi:MAG: cytochrome D1 domain-containing protein [Hydrogenothermaceae bacterium]